jgi:hypothetical protein
MTTTFGLFKKRLIQTLMGCFLLSIMDAMAQGNLVQNGNFDEGFTAWTGLSAYIGSPPGVPGGGNVGEGGDIYQTIPTVVGDEYQISLYGATQIDYGPYTIAVDINGNELSTFTTPPYTSGQYYLQWGSLTSSFTASSTSTLLDIVNVPGGNMWLANVDMQLVAVPEPSTTMLIFMGATMVISKRYFRGFGGSLFGGLIRFSERRIASCTTL